MRRLVQNQVECLKCGDKPLSAHRHDFNTCQCGSISVDGGLEYTRRIGDTKNTRDMSLMMDESVINDMIKAVQWANETDRNEFGIALAVLRVLRDNNLLDIKKFK